jgi:RHS repeat-associated protein
MTDALGSAIVAVDGAGNVTAAQLYDPYGNGRYQSGSMPGSYGYTGQRSDALTGLDYYKARYYDPLASQFISADTILPSSGDDVWGLSRYAYVEGSPLSAPTRRAMTAASSAAL